MKQPSWDEAPAFAFQPGQPLDLTAVLAGVFREGSFGSPNVSMALNFAADPVRVTSIPAPLPGLPLSLIPIQTPFRMTGIGEEQQILFTGAGTLTTQGVISMREPGRITVGHFDWRFSSSSSTPTPEPASMFLLGTGIVGCSFGGPECGKCALRRGRAGGVAAVPRANSGHRRRCARHAKHYFG